MAELLIGLCTGILCLLIFRFEHRDASRRVKLSEFLFLLLTTGSAFLVVPTDAMFLWIGLSFLLYCVLDDWLTKNLYMVLPILVTLFFLIIFGNPYLIFSVFLFSFIFIGIAKWTDEQFIGEGDVYFLLPFLVLLPPAEFFWLLFLSMMFVSLCIYILSGYRACCKRTPVSDIAFTPFLFLAGVLVLTDSYANRWMFFLFVLYVLLTPLFLLLRKKN